jgi:plasmid stability protein
MPEILVRGLDQETLDRLKRRARTSGRSLQQEVKAILEQSAGMLTMAEMRRLSRAWKHRLGGPTVTDSADLIREDRDSR